MLSVTMRGTGSDIVFTPRRTTRIEVPRFALDQALGERPLVIDDELILLDWRAGIPAAGGVYIDWRDHRVYQSDGDPESGSLDPDELPFTGVHVRDSGRLVVSGAPNSRLWFRIDDDFVNQGTVTAVANPESRPPSLEIRCASWLNEGTIDLHGVPDQPDAISLEISAMTGKAANRGTILASGHDVEGDEGGDGAWRLKLRAAHGVENRGSIRVRGGRGIGEGGIGGDGGLVQLLADGGGDVRMTGTVDASGGPGAAEGGHGGRLEMRIPDGGDILHSGAMIALGGDSEGGPQ